ncbi:MAG: flagellar FliJ family protein [Phycisphaerales bacterium]|nr:flagellar FliJ family protein [Phycisphaerales bacterium]
MSTGRFEFSLQPKLDQLASEKSKRESALRLAVGVRDEAQQALDRLNARRARLVEELNAEEKSGTEQGAPARPAYELLDQGKAFDACSAGIEAVDGQLRSQELILARAQDVVGQRERDLIAVMTELQALEKLRDRQRQEWELQADRARQGEVDDAGIAAWNRKPRNGP